ncbi:MAG: hypothetical protein M9891_13315 [Austwickia sp.]|nr:hypothetical protein [Actinomycetota bacterium]MCB1252893.1 hypothetical protein [Austwickia sp.]MCO5310236.1 hypothetical protein [Austwickia sp.]
MVAVAPAVRPDATPEPERTGSARETGWAAGVGLLGLALWAYSIPGFRVDPDTMTGLGLLGQAPPAWFAAAGLSAAGLLAYAVRGRAASWALSVLHLAVTAVLFGTTAVLYEFPRYAWAYKHLGVTEYFLAGHPIDRSLDIYQNWPGFFALGAALTRLTTVDPMTMARWAEPFFAVLFGFCVYYAVGGISRDRRVRWGAVAIYLLGNWIGQGYYAPQALAICLQLIFFGAVLRGVVSREPRRWLARMLGRLRLRPRRGGVESAGTAAPGIIAVLAFAALTTTHQLTPVATLLQLGVLVLAFRVRAWWVVVLVPLLEVAWLATAWEYLSARVTLLNFNVMDNVRTPTAEGYPALPWMALTGSSARVTTGIVALVAVAGAVAQLRRRTPDPALFALAGASVVVLAMNGYGAEGMLRVYVYSLPWLAAFGAYGLTRLRPRAGAGVAAATAVLIFGPCLFASMAADRSNYMSGADVAASRWFETNTPPGSYAIYLNGNVPARSTGNYGEHFSPDGNYTPSILGELPPGPFTLADLVEGADTMFRRVDPANGYLILGPSQERAGTMWGHFTADEYDRLVAMFENSPDYRVVHRDGDAVVLKYLGGTR